MNIFVLDKDPIIAARMQCDKHVVKMCLETAQLLCSIFPEGEAPYKRTHYNHPCAKWARESLGNYLWLIIHGETLCQEYTYRYGKRHKSEQVIEWCRKNWKYEMFPKDDYSDIPKNTPFPKCMPDEYKVEDIVQSYRNYYIGAKKDFAKWTNRILPYWWV